MLDPRIYCVLPENLSYDVVRDLADNPTYKTLDRLKEEFLAAWEQSSDSKLNWQVLRGAIRKTLNSVKEGLSEKTRRGDKIQTKEDYRDFFAGLQKDRDIAQALQQQRKRDLLINLMSSQQQVENEELRVLLTDPYLLKAIDDLEISLKSVIESGKFSVTVADLNCKTDLKINSTDKPLTVTLEKKILDAKGVTRLKINLELALNFNNEFYQENVPFSGITINILKRKIEIYDLALERAYLKHRAQDFFKKLRQGNYFHSIIKDEKVQDYLNILKINHSNADADELMLLLLNSSIDITSFFKGSNCQSFFKRHTDQIIQDLNLLKAKYSSNIKAVKILDKYLNFIDSVRSQDVNKIAKDLTDINITDRDKRKLMNCLFSITDIGQIESLLSNDAIANNLNSEVLTHFALQKKSIAVSLLRPSLWTMLKFSLRKLFNWLSPNEMLPRQRITAEGHFQILKAYRYFAWSYYQDPSILTRLLSRFNYYSELGQLNNQQTREVINFKRPTSHKYFDEDLLDNFGTIADLTINDAIDWITNNDRINLNKAAKEYYLEVFTQINEEFSADKLRTFYVKKLEQEYQNQPERLINAIECFYTGRVYLPGSKKPHWINVAKGLRAKQGDINEILDKAFKEVIGLKTIAPYDLKINKRLQIPKDRTGPKIKSRLIAEYCLLLRLPSEQSNFSEQFIEFKRHLLSDYRIFDSLFNTKPIKDLPVKIAATDISNLLSLLENKDFKKLVKISSLNPVIKKICEKLTASDFKKIKKELFTTVPSLTDVKNSYNLAVKLAKDKKFISKLKKNKLIYPYFEQLLITIRCQTAILNQRPSSFALFFEASLQHAPETLLNVAPLLVDEKLVDKKKGFINWLSNNEAQQHALIKKFVRDYQFYQKFSQLHKKVKNILLNNIESSPFYVATLLNCPELGADYLSNNPNDRQETQRRINFLIKKCSKAELLFLSKCYPHIVTQSQGESRKKITNILEKTAKEKKIDPWVKAQIDKMVDLFGKGDSAEIVNLLDFDYKINSESSNDPSIKKLVNLFIEMAISHPKMSFDFTGRFQAIKLISHNATQSLLAVFLMTKITDLISWGDGLNLVADKQKNFSKHYLPKLIHHQNIGHWLFQRPELVNELDWSIKLKLIESGDFEGESLVDYVINLSTEHRNQLLSSDKAVANFIKGAKTKSDQMLSLLVEQPENCRLIDQMLIPTNINYLIENISNNAWEKLQLDPNREIIQKLIDRLLSIMSINSQLHYQIHSSFKLRALLLKFTYYRQQSAQQVLATWPKNLIRGVKYIKNEKILIKYNHYARDLEEAFLTSFERDPNYQQPLISEFEKLVDLYKHFTHKARLYLFIIEKLPDPKLLVMFEEFLNADDKNYALQTLYSATPAELAGIYNAEYYNKKNGLSNECLLTKIFFTELANDKLINKLFNEGLTFIKDETFYDPINKRLNPFIKNLLSKIKDKISKYNGNEISLAAGLQPLKFFQKSFEEMIRQPAKNPPKILPIGHCLVYLEILHTLLRFEWLKVKLMDADPIFKKMLVKELHKKYLQDVKTITHVDNEGYKFIYAGEKGNSYLPLAYLIPIYTIMAELFHYGDNEIECLLQESTSLRKSLISTLNTVETNPDDLQLNNNQPTFHIKGWDSVPRAYFNLVLYAFVLEKPDLKKCPNFAKALVDSVTFFNGKFIFIDTAGGNANSRKLPVAYEKILDECFANFPELLNPNPDKNSWQNSEASVNEKMSTPDLSSKSTMYRQSRFFDSSRSNSLRNKGDEKRILNASEIDPFNNSKI